MTAIESLAFLKDTGLSVVSVKGNFGTERFSLYDDEELAVWHSGDKGSSNTMIPDDYIKIIDFLKAYKTNDFVPYSEPPKRPWSSNSLVRTIEEITKEVKENSELKSPWWKSR